MKGHAAKKGRRWYAVIDETTPDGRRQRRWHSGYATKREAEAAVVRLLGDQQRGAYVKPSKETLGSYMRAWLDGRQPSLRPSTWHGYDKNLRVHIAPRIGEVPVQQLTRERIGTFYAELQAERRLSPRSVRHVHTPLRRALRDLVDDHKLAHNPAERVELPKVNAVEMRTWTKVDVQAFLDHVHGDRLYALWVLALATGARRGELCGLAWRSVDLDAATVTITDTLLDVGGKVIDGKPKTARGRRVVALDAISLAALRAHRTAQLAERLAFGPGYNGRDLVFVSEIGEPLRPAWLTRRWSQLVQAAGVPKIRLQDARHTSASIALAAGVPLGIVSERLGHARTSITLDTYAHTLPGQHREAADRLADALFGR